MAIIHFTLKESAVPVGAANVEMSMQQNIPMWTWQTHIGLCLEERERNGHEDSDWDMLVWNPETQSPEWIYGFASTRGWSYPCYGSRPDATPEVVAAYREYCRRRDDKARRVHAERLAAMPQKGMTLRVVKGRKVPVGTTGRCFWSSTRFQMDRVLGTLFMGYEGRVGIETASGRQFTDVRNVEIVEAQ